VECFSPAQRKQVGRLQVARVMSPFSVQKRTNLARALPWPITAAKMKAASLVEKIGLGQEREQQIPREAGVLLEC